MPNARSSVLSFSLINQRLETYYIILIYTWLEKQAPYSDHMKYILRPTTETEIKAVFGLLYLAGVFRSNRMNLEDLWSSDGLGIDIFRTTMSLKRFMFIISYLRFDNRESRSERRKIDQFAPMRTIFEAFVKNCKDY